MAASNAMAPFGANRTPSLLDGAETIVRALMPSGAEYAPDQFG